MERSFPVQIKLQRKGLSTVHNGALTEVVVQIVKTKFLSEKFHLIVAVAIEGGYELKRLKIHPVSICLEVKQRRSTVNIFRFLRFKTRVIYRSNSYLIS